MTIAPLRDRLAAFAQSLANQVPQPARAVVVITDERGEWVAVGMSTSPQDAALILAAAVHGPDKQEHGAGPFGIAPDPASLGPHVATEAELEKRVVQTVMAARSKLKSLEAVRAPYGARDREMAYYVNAQLRAEEALETFRAEAIAKREATGKP